MTDKPNYYAVLTADVRYDKNLRCSEKLMYAEITALSNKDGYCTASNEYFAELYGVTTKAVSGWVSNLKSRQYINVSFKRKGAVITQRKIKITGPSDASRITKSSSVTDNQKVKENTINNIELVQLEAYCAENNLNVDCVIFLTHYQASEWKTKSGKPVKNWKNLLRSWSKNRKARIKKNVSKTSENNQNNYWENQNHPLREKGNTDQARSGEGLAVNGDAYQEYASSEKELLNFEGLEVQA